MARKGNLKKKGVGALNDDNNRGGKVAKVKTENVETDINSNGPSTPRKDRLDGVDDGTKGKQKGGRSVKKESKPGKDVKKDLEDLFTYKNDVKDGMESSPTVEPTGVGGSEETVASGYHGSSFSQSSLGDRPEGLGMENEMDSIGFSWKEAARKLRESALPIMWGAGAWIERQKPLLYLMRTKMYCYRDLVRTKIELAYPVVLRWFMHLGNIVLILSMVWLDCAFRGIDSLLRMGTTSIFTILWCGVLSAIAMIGFVKFFAITVVAVLLGVYAGLTLAVLLVALCGIVCLWLYGSFWTTSLLILLGGLSFAFKRERLALFLVTIYSAYCCWTYVGWTGLLLGLNLSFISSDALLYFFRNNVSDQRRPNRPSEQTAGMQGPHGFSSGDPLNGSGSESGFRHSADHGPGVPSTSGTDIELSSEEEVIRLLNCSNHYSALGLSRYEDVDVSVLKREYRKKAMLVHPDKNMGNEKAVEAFKKLQNAYEVLLDSPKRKTYDDELRREELLNYFQRIQHESQKNGFFPSGFSRPGNEREDPFAEARRIACKKCGDFHIWFHTKKSKCQARWCQDCMEFHAAKDGDGWVEQSSQPFLFGILQKVDVPVAFVCADSRVYDATEWYICQGMRCPANTHKPSFHVSTSITSKHGSKGSSSGHRGGGGIPSSNAEESMTEEEFFEWLQNAVQAGAFDNFGGSTSAESPPGKNGSGFKTNGNSNASSSSKRKKKGKKQW